MSIAASCKLDLNKDGAFETDISSYLLEASIQQGRKKSLDPMNHAVATIKLNNADGRFSRKGSVGKQDIGASESSLSANAKFACKFTATPIYIRSLVWRGKAQSGTAHVMGVIYSDNAGAPGALVATTAEATIDTTYAWHTLSFSGAVALAAGVYWLGVITDGGIALRQDGGAANQEAFNSDTYSDGPADPFGSPTYLALAVSIYAVSDFKRGAGIQVSALSGGIRTFSGYITSIEQDPYIGSQEVVVTATDRLGMAARQLLKAGKFRQQPVGPILNRLLDRMESTPEILNPGGEDGSTIGYSAVAAGTTISAVNTTFCEGDYAIQALCDGTVAGQGIRHTLLFTPPTDRKLAGALRTAPGDGSVTAVIRGLSLGLVQVWAFNITIYDDRWTYWTSGLLTGLSGHRYIEIITPAAMTVTIYSDCLHQVLLTNIIDRNISPYMDAIAELVALYDAPGLDALEKLVATEAGGFLFMREMATLYGAVFASCQAYRDITTTPVATFADDGSGVRYTGFRLEPEGDSTTEPVSEARVESEGTYGEAEEETTIWELSPLPLSVPASTTVKLRAEYSAPAKKCRHIVAGSDQGAIYAIAADANDGCLKKSGSTYPPTGTPTVWATTLIVGQVLDYVTYKKYRPFLRWDTSGIGAGSTVTSVKLRLYLTALYKSQAWTLEARQPGGSAYDWGTLDASDWSAAPGSDTLRGSLASSGFPDAGQWLEFDLDIATINKTGITALYLCSDRDVSDSAPIGVNEHAIFVQREGGAEWAAQLVVQHSAIVPVTQVFRNYGAGADIELTGTSEDAVLYTVEVKGYAYSQGAERSLVVEDAPSPPDEPNPLSVEMPHQGTRTADMTAEATRLAARHDGAVDRCEIDLEELDAASLAQMQARQINDLVTVKNIEFDHSTKVNGDFFIEGVNWTITDQGKVLRMTLSLEAK